MNDAEKPQIFLIGGPNGSGKTTTANELLPVSLNIFEYVNADSIAAGLSPFKPENMAIQAGKLMLRRIKELAEQRKTFAFETTMASRTFGTFLNQCKKKGYITNVIFLWLQNPDLAVERVKLRVKTGGHNIPQEIILKRYVSGIRNFFSIYQPISNNWSVYDNSGKSPVIIAEKSLSSKLKIVNEHKWKIIKELKK
ncbi:MAG: zeta toxin family protein [Fibrobacteria bacterium]|nr:zeta toxin family protein [Fibrobacteria bacterium]